MSRRVHEDAARLFLFGALTIVLGIGIVVVGSRIQNGGALPGKQYTYVDASVRDVGTLKTAQKVTINGVNVGVVNAIKYVDGHAVVTLRLNGTHHVYSDASIAIGNESAVGRKYVQLDPGSPAAGALPDEGIPLSRTRAPQDVTDVLSAFDQKARDGLATASLQLGGGSIGHGPDANGALRVSDKLISGFGDVMNTLKAPDTKLVPLLHTTDSLLGSLATRDEELRLLLRQGDATLKALNVDDGKPLRDSVSALPSTLLAVKSHLAQLRPVLDDVAVAARTLAPGARALGASSSSLRGFLRQSLTPLRRVPGVSKTALPAVQSLTGTMADARPLAPLLERTITSAEPFLRVLAPFVPDLGRTLSYHDMLSGHFSPTEHYFSAMLAFPGAYNVLPYDPLADGDPYPGPGKAFGPSRGAGK